MESQRHLEEQFNNDITADCTITNKEQPFKLHKLILGSHSRWFEEQFEHQGKNEQPVEVKDEPPDIVETMLRFFYSNTQSYKIPRTDNKISEAGFNAAMVGLAYRFGANKHYDNADSLYQYSLKRYKKVVESGQAPAWDLLRMINKIYEQLPPSNQDLRIPLVRRIAREYGVCFENRDSLYDEQGASGKRFAKASRYLQCAIAENSYFGAAFADEMFKRVTRCKTGDWNPQYTDGICGQWRDVERHEDMEADSLVASCAECFSNKAHQAWNNAEDIGVERLKAYEEEEEAERNGGDKQRRGEQSGGTTNGGVWYHLPARSCSS